MCGSFEGNVFDLETSWLNCLDGWRMPPGSAMGAMGEPAADRGAWEHRRRDRVGRGLGGASAPPIRTLDRLPAFTRYSIYSYCDKPWA